MNTSVIDMSAAASPQRQQPSDTTAIVQVIERAARDPNIDIDKMERLLAMQERVLARDAETQFNEAMTLAQSEMGRVSTDATNPQTRSEYATYGKLDRAVRPIYTKHGFSLSFDEGEAPKEKPMHVRILCHVSHRAGHTRIYHKDMPADGKGAKGGDVMTLTHATGAAQSYGMRYLLKGIFNIAIGEDDNDGNDEEGERISEKQIADLEALLSEVGQNKAEFMNWARISSLSQIQSAAYSECVRVIEARRGGAKTTYSQDKFDTNFAAWSDLIADGKTTAARIIAKIESAAPLTDAQKKRLTDIKLKAKQ